MEQMIHLDNKNLYSVAGIALHPTDTNILYLSVGRNCDPSQTAILESTNAGVDFSVVPVNGGIPFWLSANGGRTCDTSNDSNGANNGDKDRQGTPLEINPFNPNELYIGTREKGVYILDLTTLNLTQIPNTSIPYNSDQYSIRSIVFHPTVPKVYVAYPGHGVFVGDLITGDYVHYGDALNSELQDAIDISISKDADYLLVACKKQGIMKATNITNTLNWTKLTGLNPPDEEGYLTADCSPHDNNVAITVVAAWNHINEFQVTTDAGNNWAQVGGSVGPGDNLFSWRQGSFASHVSQIAFDPVNAFQVHYTSWFSTFTTDNFTTTGPNDWHNHNAKGHEEIVPTDLVAMPTNIEGNFLMAGSGDHSGFVFDSGMHNPDNFATFHITDRATSSVGSLKKCASLDFSEKQSDHMVVCVTKEWGASDAGVLTTSDGGLTWDLLAGYNASYQKSLVAMSSDNPDNIIALSKGAMRYTLDGGNTFLNSTGTTATTSPTSCTIPYNIVCKGATDVMSGSVNPSVFGAFRNITADTNFDCVFYFYDWNGDFSISTDGGETWCIVNDNTLPASNDSWQKARLISIPGHPGHLWININQQLWHSTNSGANWSNYSALHSANKARALSFGKGVNTTYEAIYIYGSIDGVSGNFFYRSDDIGITWTKINDHAEYEVWGDNKIIAGDRNVAGRLYATASGQGVIYGDSVCDLDCDDDVCSTDDSMDLENCLCIHTPIPPPDCDDNDSSTTDVYVESICKCIHVPLIALPLELISFDVINQDRNVLVNWSTENEQIIDHFIVERRHEDELDFKFIARVNANGLDSSRENYSVNDLIDGSAGKYYYRLRIIDAYGSSELSQVRSINVDGKEINSFRLYPNPAASGVFISGIDTSAKNLRISIYNRVGQLVNSKFELNSNVAQVDLQDLIPGIYIVEVSQDNVNRSLTIFSFVYLYCLTKLKISLVRNNS